MTGKSRSRRQWKHPCSKLAPEWLSPGQGAPGIRSRTFESESLQMILFSFPVTQQEAGGKKFVQERPLSQAENNRRLPRELPNRFGLHVNFKLTVADEKMKMTSNNCSLKMPYLLPYRVLCLVAQLYLTLCNPQGSPHIMLFFLENFLEFTQRVGLRKPTRLLPVDGLSPLSKEIPRTETVCCSGSDSTFEFLGSCRFPGFLAIHKKIRFKP